MKAIKNTCKIFEVGIMTILWSCIYPFILLAEIYLKIKSRLETKKR